jgi:hypothetical protein
VREDYWRVGTDAIAALYQGEGIRKLEAPVRMRGKLIGRRVLDEWRTCFLRRQCRLGGHRERRKGSCGGCAHGGGCQKVVGS